MMPNDQNKPLNRMAAWIDDLASHGEAADTIAALGDTAIPALAVYLAGDPQAIPHARCFAVAMLARLHDDAATAALRDVLHMHPLKSLVPSFAESEYVVKSDALEALVLRSYPELSDDIAFGLDERLRVAIVAAGKIGLSALADLLVDLLDDDVLADDAVVSLTMLGQPSARAIMTRLDAWLIEAELSARRRLASIRALRVLHRTGGAFDSVVITRALNAQHPMVSAAAALLIWPRRCDPTVIESLLHGAIGFDRELADDCRIALEQASADIQGRAQRALRRNAEPDLYGQSRPLSSEQQGWLKRRALN
jgi:hypothetical protein